MAMRSFPFNSINGDRKFSALHWTEYFSWLIGNGIFPNPANNLQVLSNNNMTITIKKGAGWINGHILVNDEDLVLSIESADGLLNRIDRVVLRLDVMGREIRIDIKKGDSATIPSVKPLQRDDDAYELGLADIRIGKGDINIKQSNITDLRLNNQYCGIVHGLINQVDTTTLFNQYQSWIEQKKNEFNTDLVDYKTSKQVDLDTWYDITTSQFESDFNTWFDTIQNILDENAAGNLLNMIEAIPRVYSGTTEPLNMKPGETWFKELV